MNYHWLMTGNIFHLITGKNTIAQLFITRQTHENSSQQNSIWLNAALIEFGSSSKAYMII